MELRRGADSKETLMKTRNILFLFRSIDPSHSPGRHGPAFRLQPLRAAAHPALRPGLQGLRYDNVDVPGYSFSRRWRVQSPSIPTADLPNVLRTGRESVMPSWRRRDRAERSNDRIATV